MTNKEKQAKAFFNQKVEELGLQNITMVINNGQIVLEGSENGSVAAFNFVERIVLVEKTAIYFFSMESVKDMILHELAHSIVGYEEGHGEAFQKVCIAIGCTGMYEQNIYN